MAFEKRAYVAPLAGNMTFLPIVERELRVAARSRFTFWSRLAAAAFALLIFGALQLLAQKSGGAFPAGQIEFGVLKWFAFIYACAMGLFLTADSLSEEKREGTLGLLFLTDLRGYDVVFGKLLTQSLRAFFGLLAAFPIMGLALLAGGVTGGEFSRSILVICNTLFVSLALGMLVSSLSRDSTKAMNGTLLLLVLILGGLPFTDFALAGFDHTKFKAILTLASPGYLFRNTGGYRFNQFWAVPPPPECARLGVPGPGQPAFTRIRGRMFRRQPAARLPHFSADGAMAVRVPAWPCAAGCLPRIPSFG